MRIANRTYLATAVLVLASTLSPALLANDVAGTGGGPQKRGQRTYSFETDMLYGPFN